jgi:serine protease
MVSRLGIKGLLAASIVLAFAFPVMAGSLAPSATVGTVKANFNTASLLAGNKYDRFIVRYRAGTTEQSSQSAATQNISAAVSRAGLNKATLSSGAVNVAYKRKLATGSHLVFTSRKLSQTEAAAFIRAIAADPSVEYVQPDVLRHAIRDFKAAATLQPASFTPTDPYFVNYQADYLAPDGTKTPVNKVANYGGANIQGAWDLADGTGVTIAVIDTGIVQHADVDTSLAAAGYDFISDAYVSGRDSDDRVPGAWDLGDWTKGDEYLATNGGCVDANNPAEDSSWHGTHVASASGAELTNNGVGMAGMAYHAKVLPVRVLGHCGGYDSDIDDAIIWASGGHVDGIPDNQNPAKVLNLSLGGGGACSASDEAAQAIASANSRGAVVVVAAGNDGADVAGSSPASCPGAVTVASIGITSKLAFYSNYNSPGESIVAIAAPGGGIYNNDGSSGTQSNPEGFDWQALNDGTTTPLPSPDGDNYGGFAGTSQATPHVAATVALMQSARIAASQPLLTPAEVLGILQNTAHAPHVTPAAGKTFGAGILDAGAAVAAAVDSNSGDPGNGDGDDATPLSNGVLLAGQSGAAGASTVYKLDVPAGALALSLRTLGGTGNVSIYVKVGSAGSASDYDYKSVHAGNSESVLVSRPTAATYYVTVVGEQAYSGVTVLGNYVAPAN